MASEESMAIVLVEQQAELALRLTQEALLVERGMIAHSAPSQDLLADRPTLDRYVGLHLDEGRPPARPGKQRDLGETA
jgi:branched-chain amino acid transport system ATP-binding protein